MKRKLIALDLFCGGGGACIGLQQAGFEVIGVDIEPHPNYPGHFIQGDALHPPIDIMKVNLIWASPPCQAWAMGAGNPAKQKEKHPDLLTPIREVIKAHPYTIIENVCQAPLRHDVVLTGEMFGLSKLRRKRAFETSFFVWGQTIPTRKMGGAYYCITGSLGAGCHFYRRKAEGKPGTLTLEEAKETMGIPEAYTFTKAEIKEAVAPPMAHYIAVQARQLIEKERQCTHSPA